MTVVERNRIKMVDMICIRKIVGTLLFLGYFDIFSDCWSSQLAIVLWVAAVYLDNMLLLLWWWWRLWCVDPQRTWAAERTQGWRWDLEIFWHSVTGSGYHWVRGWLTKQRIIQRIINIWTRTGVTVFCVPVPAPAIFKITAVNICPAIKYCKYHGTGTVQSPGSPHCYHPTR